MRVNLFTAADDGNSLGLLVLPYGPMGGIPSHLRHLAWRNIATTTSDDPLLAFSPAKIETEIACNGFALVRLGQPE